MLNGCSAETVEPLLDVYGSGNGMQPAQMRIELPNDTAVSVMKGDTGTLYYGDHYAVSVETYPSGNISNTLYQITGHDMEELTVLELADDMGNSYRCGWSAAGEEGEQVGQCVVIDDGCYHYCLTIVTDADYAAELRPVIDMILNSYSFSSY